MSRFSAWAGDVVRPGVGVNVQSVLSRRGIRLECFQCEADQVTIFEVLRFAKLSKGVRQYIDDLRLCAWKDDDRRHLLAGAFVSASAHGGVDPSHMFVHGAADALATVDRREPVLGFPSRVE